MDNIVSALLSIIVVSLLWVTLLGIGSRPLSKETQERINARSPQEQSCSKAAAWLLTWALFLITALILWLGFRGLINSGFCN